MRRQWEANGFSNVGPGSRGVDGTLFKVRDRSELDLPELPDRDALPRPVFMNVGRVAVEKNIAAFLALDLPGTKVVVGDGPQMAELRRRFPETRFVGMQHGARLAQYYAFADVFVMPSLTETFGMVQLESLACGTPVAAFPVPGPKDLFADQDPAAPVGVLDEDLRVAALGAAEIPRARCAAFSARFTWRACAETAYRALAPGRRSA